MARVLKIEAKQDSGQIHEFTVMVGTQVVVHGDGSRPRSHEGEIPDQKTGITVWISGVPGSRVLITVDLPGTQHDFKTKFALTSTLEKLEFEV